MIKAVSDDSPVILLAACYHPKPELRSALRSGLDAVLAESQPKMDEVECRRVLTESRGTTVEPFRLSSENLELATYLIRFWSAAPEPDHIRIVSEESMGSVGGLVIDRSKSTSYCERYLYGKRRRDPNSSWFFAPGLAPRPKPRTTVELAAHIEVDDEGISVKIRLSDFGKIDGHTLRELQRGGRVLGRDLHLDKLGLRVGTQRGYLLLETGSPAAMLRFLAVCQENAVIQLEWSTKRASRFRGYIQLRPPKPEPSPLRMQLIETVEKPYAWTDAKLPPVETNASERIEISRWMQAHSSWVADLLEEMS